MADVFISYKSERRNSARHLAKVIKLHGYSVWYDYGLASGADFGPQIEAEIRRAKVAVVLWCDLSRTSPWVLEEAQLALNLNLLVPTWIEKVDIPLGFARLDTVDLTTWDGAPRAGALDRFFDQLVQRIGRPMTPDVAALREFEDDWRSFGSPTLARFPLTAPIEDKFQRSALVTPPSQESVQVSAAASAREAWETLKNTTNIARLKQFVKSVAHSPLALAAEQRIEELEIGEPASLALRDVPENDWRCFRPRAITKAIMTRCTPASLRALAAQGDSKAQLLLGTAYVAGITPFASDPQEGLRLLRLAADQGEIEARTSIGTAYFNGLGVDIDMKAAVQQFRLASDAGSPNGIALLGRAYILGDGVERDQERAVALFKRAADLGSAAGISNLGVAYKEGAGGLAKSDEKFVEQTMRAAALEYPTAVSNLAHIYETGVGGVARDPAETKRLYERAADLGDERAIAWLESQGNK